MAGPLKDASPVRRLARRFADGMLDRRVYIVERRRLLDAIAAGKLSLPGDPVPSDPPKPPAPCVLTEEDDTVELRQSTTPHDALSPAPDAAASPTEPPPASGGWWMVAALVTGLVGVAIWLWWELTPL